MKLERILILISLMLNAYCLYMIDKLTTSDMNQIDVISQIVDKLI